MALLARFACQRAYAAKCTTTKRITTQLVISRGKKQKVLQKQARGSPEVEEEHPMLKMTEEEKIANYGPNWGAVPTKEVKIRGMEEPPQGEIFEDELEFYDQTVTPEEEAELNKLEQDYIKSFRDQVQVSKWSRFKSYQEKEAYINSGITFKPGTGIDNTMRKRFLRKDRNLDEIRDLEAEVGFTWHITFRRPALIKLQCPTRLASPGPPLGPLLGMHGIPTGIFVQRFNEETEPYPPGVMVKVIIFRNRDRKDKRTVNFKIFAPPTSALVKRMSQNFKISRDDIARIAKYKFPGLPLRETYGQVRGTVLSINEIDMCPKYEDEDIATQKQIDVEIEKLSLTGGLNKRLLPKAVKKK